jgi:cardiolipin synthase
MYGVAYLGTVEGITMHINWKKEILTIPNLLSVFRLALIPVYITIYLNAVEPCDYYLAAGILALSCMTDMIDGYIARRFNMISNMGKFLDPIADKMTQFTLIVSLAFRYPVLYFLIALFVVKESFQLIAVGINLRKKKMLDCALMSGKVCTTVLFTSLIAMVLFPTIKESTVGVIAAVDAIFLLIAFVDDVRDYYGKEPKVTDIKSIGENSIPKPG